MAARGPDESGSQRSLRVLAQLVEVLAPAGESKRRVRGDELLVAHGPDAELGPGDPLDPAWRFCVPACFLDSLDIHATVRKKDGHAEETATQGPNLAFRAGAVLYDHPAAYREAWRDALAQVRLVAVVDAATPASAAGGESGPSRGTVEMRVLAPDRGGNGLHEVAARTTTQDGFVRFLITGELADAAEV
jgi:hypothetical protein